MLQKFFMLKDYLKYQFFCVLVGNHFLFVKLDIVKFLTLFQQFN